MSRPRKEKHLCDECGKNFDELVTRELFIMTYGVDFVCYKCFEKLEGCKFEEYTIERHYGKGVENE